MTYITEKILLSISHSLKSNTRNFGPKVSNKNIKNIIGGTDVITSDFSTNIIDVVYNVTPAEYYEYSIKYDGNTFITDKGALVTYSGVKTGRSPKDKRIVTKDKNVWNDDNAPHIVINEDIFSINKETSICYLNSLDRLYVFDGYACWHPSHRYKVRVISSRPYHCLFMYNMLIRPTEDEIKNFGDPDITIYNAGCFPCNRYNEKMTSSTSVVLNLQTKEIVILGTQYAGEMKKGIFSLMHYFMPQKNILTLHSSCNISHDKKNVCLFFGLSGTGKTTLSADSSRMLIGDDEHCWDDNSVFNIEGGCYAKAINLDPNKEKEICNAIKFGALFENTVLDKNRKVDFTDDSITQNIRLSYPINYIENAHIPCIINKHPDNIILLTCDAFGVLPLISKLTVEQACYHFINGYTSKIAGTEDGITEPVATFSSCYGEAFLVLEPKKYAELLKKKIIKHNVKCWLVNTGWVGGKYGIGKRCDLNITRKIVEDIHNGKLLLEKYTNFPIFDLQVPVTYSLPRDDWKDKDMYDKELNNLFKLFEKNYSKYS